MAEGLSSPGRSVQATEEGRSVIIVNPSASTSAGRLLQQGGTARRANYGTVNTTQDLPHSTTSNEVSHLEKRTVSTQGQAGSTASHQAGTSVKSTLAASCKYDTYITVRG